MSLKRVGSAVVGMGVVGMAVEVLGVNSWDGCSVVEPMTKSTMSGKIKNLIYLETKQNKHKQNQAKTQTGKINV